MLLVIHASCGAWPCLFLLDLSKNSSSFKPNALSNANALYKLKSLNSSSRNSIFSIYTLFKY